MALTDANVLMGQSAQIAQQMFAPATNMLSNALNNAVESGRRMVDLQSHQEDIFMTEREKLRLATERKGLEARRIFENDRNFGEDVLRDRRNFDESVLQDRRDFGLQSTVQLGQLGMAQERLGMDRERLGFERENAAANRGLINARAKAYAEGRTGYGSTRAGLTPGAFAAAHDITFRDYGSNPIGEDAPGTVINEGGGRTGAPRTTSYSRADVDMLKKTSAARDAYGRLPGVFYREDVLADLPKMSPEQQREVLPTLNQYKPRPAKATGRAATQRQWGPGTRNQDSLYDMPEDGGWQPQQPLDLFNMGFDPNGYQGQ